MASAIGARMRLEHRVILALDLPDVERAKAISASVRGFVDAVKVGWPLVLAGGLSVVRQLSEDGYVLCDFKVADIPNTNRLIVEQAVGAGASGVTCHGFAGEDSVRACIAAAGRAEVFVITEMSHPGGAEYTAKHADELAQLAVRVGAAGIIAPATRPERVKALRSLIGSRLLLTPGVGAQGGRPTDAILAGADAIIVGRAIYDAEDPAEAASKFSKEARAAVLAGR